MATKTSIFSSVISGSPMITSEKLVGSENYLSWFVSVELWFMGQGYEDHLVTQEADIPEVNRVQWRKIDAQLCSVLWQSVDPRILLHLQTYKTCFKFWIQAKRLYTNDIQRLYKVVSAIVHISQQNLDLSTYIGQIASLKEEFLTVMPLTPDILGSSSVPSLDDVFARLLRISSTQTLPSDSISDSSMLVSQTTSRGGRSSTRVTWKASSHCPYGLSLRFSAASAFELFRISDILGFYYLCCPACNKDFFSSITTTSALPTVTLANGSQTVAKGIGLALPLPSLPLTSVLYTPECPFNLISIGKITRTLNCSITFCDKFVTLQDRSTRKTIGIGHESQGLYHLTSDSSPAVCISTDAPLLIHNRLGHPSLSKFQKMVHRFSTLSSLPCESCQLGKHTRVSFPKCLNNRAKSLFEFVHTDVWGPCRTASTLGFQYFVTFIDDYSRCTCDNAREYFSTSFTSFMSHHGILHQSSCAHTPQQNGVAEHKNRHLVETARTILLHSNVPFRFWGDAVLTACYLINHMPSSVLHDQIPHSFLFPDQPLYFLSPRVFGCTCFVHILTPGQDKLSAKAMKCLFLGYSRLQKGYRCYSLETHRYFISADVTFFEDSPFFSTTSESLPVSEVLLLPIVSPTDVVPPRPLQVYHRRPRVVAPLPFAEAPADSLLIPLASPAPALPSPNDLPIAVRKVNVGPDGQVDRLLARLVAKGYTQVYGSDYGETFSHVAKIASVRLLLSMAAMCSWPLYQLDIKNVFLHGDLTKEVYMDQPPGFVAQGKSGLVCRLRRSLYGLKQSPRAWFGRFSFVVQEFGMLRSTADHSVFYYHNSLGQCIYLVVYIDDIVITNSDQDAQSSYGVVLSQMKYALDILEKNRQFLQSPCDSHWDAVIRILRYIKSTPGQGVLYENRGHTQVVGYIDADWAGSPTDRCSTSGYCVFIGGNLISWKSKKQDVVARSSVEAEYRVMALATCELIWLRHLLRELRFGKDEQMKLICDNQAALHIASNPVFHERTKHIEVDCHFIREKIASGCVATSIINSNDQLADIFTKSLRGPRIKYICNKLGAYDVYAPA
ncbi:Retrovirus-related Pol polyprotein from transposon RE2 [Vitis vinifera]|uniref:Retrovirus-related Pol polyprotein from transposon RE2 n=2 Tax=Vitis vinifera TaxID=29760 RepID=A0A438DDA9_VITVI|nr:Retrovirus-related Pol polyprotein from transposon RE2 [Vitis vinifera]